MNPQWFAHGGGYHEEEYQISIGKIETLGMNYFGYDDDAGLVVAVAAAVVVAAAAVVVDAAVAVDDVEHIVLP